MAQTFNTSISFVQSTSRKDRRKGAGSLSVSAFGGGVGNVADSATQAWVRNNFVDKTTEQEISAPKIFSQGIKIGDIAFYKHPDGYVYLDETLVLKGGVVMYGNGSGVEVPSIFESLPIDNYTIKRDGNGALYVDETALSVSGGGGGGVADSVYWNNVIGKPSWIGPTKPSYKYSEIDEKPDLSVYAKLSDIPSLSGYATQSWVENKGYLLAATASSTYQSKITSSNKLAYSLISGTPDLSVYALKTAIPTKLSQLTDDVVAGKYLSITGGTVNGSITANSFIGSLTGNADGATTVRINNAASNVLCPLVFVSNTTAGNKDLFVSTGKSLTFNPSNGNLTATTFTGNLTGNADSATKLATARTIWGQSFDGTKDITSAMTVDGDATFSSKVVIGGISLRKVDNYLYLDSSLVLSGGLTMYGDDGVTVKPIWESIPLDESTLAWLDGKLSVIGGVGSGGGISEAFLNATLQGYQPKITTTNKLAYSLISGTPDLSVYAKLSDIPSLAGYATQTWVENKGYLLATTASNTYQQKITSSNKLAYSLISGTPDLSVYALKTAIPTKLSQLTDDVVAGKYLSINGGTVNGSITANSFIGSLTGNADSATTVYLGNSNANGVFPVPFVSNKTVGNKSLFVSTTNTLIFNPSTGGLSAKSFIGNLTGNADSATDASNLTQTTYTGDVNADDLYGSKSRVLKLSTNANLPKGMNYGNILYIGGGDTGFMLAGSYSRDKLLFRRGTNKNNAAQNIHTNSWKEIAFTDSNVASATKLATARTIWGQSFDGTGDVTGDMLVDGKASVIYRYGTSADGAAILSVGAYKSNPYGLIFYSNGAQASSIQSQLFDNSLYTTLCLNHKGGNVAIGGTTADAKLHVHGTAKFTGDTTFSSKVVIGTIPVYQSADGTLFVDANVVFRGGVAMYGNTTTTINEE